MLRRLRFSLVRPFLITKRSFLTVDYKCNDAWNDQKSAPILRKINLTDFYNVLDQNYASKNVISALDVDLFANAINDSIYLEELKELLHKLRLSAETGNMLESTQYATIRHYIEYEQYEELINILKEPLNFGVFLDNYTANILLDKLISENKFELASIVASMIMLQEDYSNRITCSLCQYACYKYVSSHTPPVHTEPENSSSKKVEEIKVRVKYLRNPYFDDHFDIKDVYTLSGKTLSWISEQTNDNLNYNLQIIGWLIYRKFNKLSDLCTKLPNGTKIYSEVLSMFKKQCENVESDHKELLEQCILKLQSFNTSEETIESALKKSIEDAINKTHSKDVVDQKKLFESWTTIRQIKLEEQTTRLDRAKRIQLIQQKQEHLKTEEQKLWFFENEENIDLEIEEKEKLIETPTQKKSNAKKSDENYIPPEIVRKRK